MNTTTEKEELYREYRDKVSGYVFSKLYDTKDAEDLVSEIFLKVYEKYSTFDPARASVSTWIYTITKNTVTDYLRRNRTYSELPDDLPDGECLSDGILREETLKELSRALSQLDERSRTLIIFRYYRQMSLKEIAERLGISYAYAKVLHKSALNSLRDFMN